MFKNQVPFRFAAILFIFALVTAAFVVNAQDMTQPIESTDTSSVEAKMNTTEINEDLFPFVAKVDDSIGSADLITSGTYAYSVLTGVALDDMSTGTTQLVGPSADDTASAVTNIGFDFWYDGVRYGQFSVNANGLARLGSTAVTTAFNNSTSGLDTVTNAPKIAPYFEDLCTGAAGKVHYKVTGSAPNRKLIVEWFNMEIPREGSCGTGTANGVFQLWLFESAAGSNPGRIQFVYGADVLPSTATDLGASVGLQAGVATNFASVTVSDDTVSYAVVNNTNLPGIPAGKSYSFTPNVPIAPTGLTFAPVTQTSIQLNWTDNATNEAAYAINRSTDGINFSFLAQTAADATSFNDTGLIPGTTYFYQVYAATEGASSSSISGSQATNAAGSDSCAGAGGDWSNTATWADGSVPTASDNVTIGSGCTVAVDTAGAVALNVTIDSGGTLQSPTTGTVTTNNLTVGGNVTNNGVLDFSTNADTSGAILTFVPPIANVTFGGTGATTDIRAITVAKGATTSTVELNPTNFTVLGVNTDTAGFLTLTSGTFKISGTFTIANRVFTAAGYSIPAIGGFWLNNPNFTVSGQNGSPTNNGLLRISSGIYNVGTSAGNSLGGGAGAVFTIEGGTVNTAGRLQTTSAVTYNQSGGDVNVCTVGNTATTACFGLTSTTNTFNMSGGNITLVLPSTNATPLDYSVSTSATVVWITNPAVTVLNVGTGAAAEIFRVTGSTPSLNIPANKTMNVGSGAAGAAIFHRGATIVNNGVIAVQGTGGSSRFDFAASGPMTYGGSGVFGTLAVPFGGVGMSANSPTGNNATINSPIIINRVNFFNGGFANSGQITLGGGAATTTVIQVGNSTTPTNAGTFDVSPVHNAGSGGHILLHLRATTTNWVTGFEVNTTRTLTQLTVDNNAVGGSLTIAGGPVTVTGTLALTNGVVNTTAANLLTNNAAATTRTTGYVDGPLARNMAVGSHTFFVGDTEFSPVVVNTTTLGAPTIFTAEAIDAPMVGLIQGQSLSRYWNLTEAGDITADLSFTYASDATDVNGVETDYRIYKSVGGVITNMCPGGPCVSDATNTLGPLVGVTDFSSWSGGENGIIDTAAPNTTIDSNPTNPSNSADAAFTFSGIDSVLAIGGFQCKLDGGAFAACTSPQNYTGLSQGSHTFEVRAVDTAGNVDPTPATFTWVIDTLAPNTTITGNPTNPTTDTSATFTFTGTDSLGMGPVLTFECKLDGGMFAACTSPQAYMGLTVGPHTFEVRAKDAAGNTDPTPASFAWTITSGSTGPVTVTATTGTTGPTDYPTVKDAFDAVNAGTHTGVVTVSIVANTTETGPAILNGSGAGSASYTALTVRAGADGVSVSGPTTTGRGLIELNGADNVTIDGDNPGTAGTNRNLTFTNTAANTITFTSVIRVALNITTVNSADNNIFRNLNIVGSSTGRNIATATSTTASENTTFGIFVGPNASAPTTAPTAITSVLTGVAAGATAANLIVENNNVVTAARAVSVNGSAATVATGLQVMNNQIGNPTAGNADQVTAIGVTVNGATNPVISGNLIWIEGYIRSSAATHAINVGVNSVNTTGAVIEKNRVNRVKQNDLQSWSAFGVNLGGGSNHVVRNNFVSGVINDQTGGTGAFGTTFGAYGIRVASGTGHQVYHNSVNLYGAMGGVTSTNLTAAFMVVATTQTGVDARNNIFVNNISGGNPTGTRNVAIYVPTGGTAAMNLTLNNNDYFVGADALNRMAQRGTTFGTGEYALADFDPNDTANVLNFRNYTNTLSAAGTNDNAGKKVDPQFVSTSDLHILATSQMESGGANAGVTDDIDGDSRTAVPDIGADEISVSGPGILQFSSSAFSTNEGTTATINVIRGAGLDGTVGVTATVTDGTATGGAACSAGIDYINPGPQVLSYNMGEALKSFNITTCTDATLKGNETVTLTLSSPTGGATIGANNPATLTIVDVPPPFSGTINVGTGETFTSLTNAGGIFQALNGAGLSANTTINITSDLTAETGAIALNQLTEFGAGGYTLTIKPSGAARTISGTSAASNGLINLNGADRVIFDGSLSGGTDRSLTLTNLQTGTSTVFWIKSANASNGANNNTIKNSIINGTSVGTTAQTTAGILAGSGVTIGGAAEAPNNNNTITNNHIYRVQNSLYNQGNVGFDQNWTITNNEFGSAVEADKNRFRGMLMGNANNFVISGNTVLGVGNFTSTTGALTGIQIAFTVTNGTITGNRISNVQNLSATGTGAFGMQLGATLTTNILIANNFIWNVQAAGSATVASNGHGITVNGAATAGGYKIYHNSINLNTDQASGTTAALNVTVAVVAAGALDVRDNIFANTQTAGATRYSVYSAAPATVFSTINYNDYFSTGSVGFIGGSARVTLADWQTATTQDANSLAIDPQFVSPTDLHLQAMSPVANLGTPLAEVTTDIDGDTRSATTPEIGADELAPVVAPGSLQFSSATYSVGEAGPTATITVTRTGGSSGIVGASYATVAGGTATGGGVCGGAVDYVDTSGTVSFGDGVTTPQTFTISICDDATIESPETVNLALTTPTGGATIGSPSAAVLTINDNDSAGGSYSIGDVRLAEGNSGPANAVFTVTYTAGGASSVSFATVSRTATAGVDYAAATGTLNFPASGSTQTQTVTVIVAGDTVKEANETFFVNLSGATGGATITDNQAVGVIVDEDRAYVADFDRDLKADFSVARGAENRWYMLPSISGVPSVVTFGTVGDRPTPGDYDGDGKTDMAFYRPSTSAWHILNSSTSTTSVFTVGAVGDKPVQGDYNGDGRTDLATYRPTGGLWSVFFISTGTSTFQSFGISTDRPVQGDYDGDAKTDLAVYRDGTWYVLFSSNSSVATVTWGNTTDKPVSGDFDGDGQFDLAIYRNGQWWILNSLTGSSSVISWGIASDIAVPADYDGDGTTDVAIFRPSDGDWYVLRSSTLTIQGLHWGLNGDFPIPAGQLPQ